MTYWTVWEHEKFADPARNARFVRDSFSWLAFLFAPLWLLANRMFVVLLVALALGAVLGLLAAPLLGAATVAWAGVVVLLWFGFEARSLKRWAMARRGWRMTAVVEARRFIEAERRYFAHRADLPPDMLPPEREARPAPGPWDAAAPVIGVMPEAPR